MEKMLEFTSCVLYCWFLSYSTFSCASVDKGFPIDVHFTSALITSVGTVSFYPFQWLIPTAVGHECLHLVSLQHWLRIVSNCYHLFPTTSYSFSTTTSLTYGHRY